MISRRMEVIVKLSLEHLRVQIEDEEPYEEGDAPSDHGGEDHAAYVGFEADFHSARESTVLRPPKPQGVCLSSTQQSIGEIGEAFFLDR